ncbi:hypothetical protein Pyn_09413 [Prunus yedoensis var. nudiflora]|uniref:Uncharacterized protein n=1 Tax=Prunus yedoensis var. nudiflora TaxID=2094558 RepID=A0A314UL04_PRUYE|nr:hypothetical protein Pyn_09413 [Prunus yedoensis var. nudiflora]
MGQVLGQPGSGLGEIGGEVECGRLQEFPHDQSVAIADWLTSLIWDTNPMDIVTWVLQNLCLSRC